MTTRTFLTGAAVSVAMAMGMASTAQGALVSVLLPEDGSKDNDCSGLFGTAPNCNVTGPTGSLFSPLIVKYDMDTAGTTIVKTTINSALYPTFGGGEILFDTDSWTYTPGAGDPGIKYWTAKAGPSFNLFWSVDDAEIVSGGACFGAAAVYTDACLSKALVVTAGTYTTPGFKALSHIGFYNTGDEYSVVPLPAAAWLLLSGLLGLGALGRRKASA